MKIFTCSACKHVAFFENSQCTRCGHTLAYLPDRGVLSAMEQELLDPNIPSDGVVRYVAIAPSLGDGSRYRLCRNYTAYAVCNWAIPDQDLRDYCPACRLNASIPNLSDPSALDSWQRLEVAKRRLVYTLLELGLPLESKLDQPAAGLAFEFKVDGPNGERALTGHCDGLVTINMNEADPPSLERTRVELGERYRTLLGHFRHESGHFYWDRLLRDSALLQSFRELFGNEQQDYAQAVQRHYAAPKQNWSDEYVSAYATMHPWEDWAETWAHYLHMVDTLETAQSYGLVLKPKAIGGAPSEQMSARRVQFGDFHDLIGAWVPLTVALNSLNRSMGLPDVYPFVLGQRVIGKLEFVHRVVAEASPGIHAGVEEDVEVPPPGVTVSAPGVDAVPQHPEQPLPISPS